MSKINFPKKQEQRLIPKYLLEYAEELQENHPDPSAEWGGSGVADIEAGTGIVITGDETKTISVDTETIPTVAELSIIAFSGSYNDLSNKPDLNIYELKTDAFTGDYGDLTNKPDLSVYELKTDAFSGDYTDLTNKPDLSIYAETADLGDCAYLDEDELSIRYSQITGTPSIPTNISAFTNDSGYITSSALPDMTNYYTKTEIDTNYYDKEAVDDIVEDVAADIPKILVNQPNPTTPLTSLSINNTNYSISQPVQKYVHHLTLFNNSIVTSATLRATATIINNTSTSMTLSDLTTYLYNNNFRIVADGLYEASGTFYESSTSFGIAGIRSYAGTTVDAIVPKGASVYSITQIVYIVDIVLPM